MANCEKHGEYSVFCRYCDAEITEKAQQEAKRVYVLPYGAFKLELMISHNLGMSYFKSAETLDPLNDESWAKAIEVTRSQLDTRQIRAYTQLVNLETKQEIAFGYTLTDEGAAITKPEYRGRLPIEDQARLLRDKFCKPKKGSKK